MRAKRIVLILPFAVFLVLLFLFYNSLNKPKEALVFALENLPEISLPVMTDPDTLLDNTLIQERGGLINIFATWCIACRAEHEALMWLKEQGIPIYGINWKDDREAAREMLLEMGDPYLYVGLDKAGIAAVALGITGAPETLIVDKQGMIRERIRGPIDEYAIKHTILPLWQEIQ